MRRAQQLRRVGADPESRRYAKDVVLNDPCSYCGGPGGTIDHIEAVTRGGTSDWTNLAAACMSCNARKHNRSLLSFLLRTATEVKT